LTIIVAMRPGVSNECHELLPLQCRSFVCTDSTGGLELLLKPKIW
jgi:hypothetical protein